MKRTLILILLSVLTLVTSANWAPAPWGLHRPTVTVKAKNAAFADPIITYHNVTGAHANPSDPNDPWLVEMYFEVDHTVNYDCYAQFQLLVWRKVGYGFPRQYTWAWVWTTYVIDLPANWSWNALFTTLGQGETYDYFNYNVIDPQRRL